MKLLNTYTLEIKKSKFICYYYEVNTVEEVKNIIESLKKDYKLNNKEKKELMRAFVSYLIDESNGNKYQEEISSFIIKKSDDKEPSGTSGMPILNIIEKNNLNHTLIAIVRYFGGIKLGKGGLIRAYGTAAKEGIKLDQK